MTGIEPAPSAWEAEVTKWWFTGLTGAHDACDSADREFE